MSTQTTIVRNPGLDVLRSLCLFLVVLQHSFLFTDAFFPKFRMLWIISHSALDVFFILSGFLIGGLLEKKYRENNSLSLKDIFIFYKRRWFKTVPMYFLVVAVCILLSSYNIYYAKDFSWKFLVFLQNLTRADFDFLPHTYSLTIEEWFYIFFPLGVFIIVKGTKYKANPFYPVIIFWIILAIAIRLIKHANGVEVWDVEIRKTILSRIDATIYGVLFYFVNLRFPVGIKKYRVLLFVLGGLLYLIATFILKEDVSLFFDNVVYYSLIPVFISLLLPFFLYLRLPSFLERAFTFQSLASYSIYLIHLPFLYMLHPYFKPNSSAASILYTVIFIILAYALGVLFYKLIEKPIMDLRDRC